MPRTDGWMFPGSSGDFWRRFGGPALTAVAALMVEALLRLDFPIPMPSGLLLLAVAYATVIGGIRSGAVSVAIGLVYYAVRLSSPEALFHYSAGDLARLAVFTVVAPALVLLVGGLQAKLHRSLAEARRAREEAERAARRLGFLADASRAIAGSLNSRETLERLARRAVEGFADVCVVDLLEDGRLHRVATAAADPDLEPLVEALRSHPPAPAGPLPAAEAARSGAPVLIDDVTDESIARLDLAPEHRELLLRLGIRSTLAVPMVARGQTLGAVTLGCTDPEERYDAEDVAIAEKLASRAALALEDARLYERALDANRAKSDFLVAVSHDFRTPLSTICLCTEQLRMGGTGGSWESSVLALDRIDNASRQLLQMIDQILDFSRVDARRQEVTVQRAPVAEILAELAQLMEPLALERGLRLTVDVSEVDGTALETDTMMVKQVLLNLLSNAVRFTPSGEVTLRSWREGEFVFCEVRDTGVGIAPEDRERIFEPFWSADSSREERARQRGGTGLGLSVARRLCQLLGGDITVESRRGSGSVFVASFLARWEPREEVDISFTSVRLSS